MLFHVNKTSKLIQSSDVSIDVLQAEVLEDYWNTGLTQQWRKFSFPTGEGANLNKFSNFFDRTIFSDWNFRLNPKFSDVLIVEGSRPHPLKIATDSVVTNGHEIAEHMGIEQVFSKAMVGRQKRIFNYECADDSSRLLAEE